MKGTTKITYKDLVKGQKIKFKSTWDTLMYDYWEIVDIDKDKEIVSIKVLYSSEDDSAVGKTYKMESYYFDEASDVTLL